MGNIIENICCKKDKDIETQLLKTTVFCSYCEQTYQFNEYYKHYVKCKHRYLYGDSINGDL